uniref:Uncharacterized protein n=1 Tax=Rhizophora mucronata TaxID=61149 RepID=A0A2P2NG27_RHIMU
MKEQINLRLKIHSNISQREIDLIQSVNSSLRTFIPLLIFLQGLPRIKHVIQNFQLPTFSFLFPSKQTEKIQSMQLESQFLPLSTDPINLICKPINQ